jgi:hypothetical protein
VFGDVRIYSRKVLIDESCAEFARGLSLYAVMTSPICSPALSAGLFCSILLMIGRICFLLSMYRSMLNNINANITLKLTPATLMSSF